MQNTLIKQSRANSENSNEDTLDQLKGFSVILNTQIGGPTVLNEFIRDSKFDKCLTPTVVSRNENSREKMKKVIQLKRLSLDPISNRNIKQEKLNLNRIELKKKLDAMTNNTTNY